MSCPAPEAKVVDVDGPAGLDAIVLLLAGELVMTAAGVVLGAGVAEMVKEMTCDTTTPPGELETAGAEEAAGEETYTLVDGEAGVEETETDPVSVAVTGQTVVYISTISVVTEPRGQLVTLAGHLETVWVE